jgi:hypothetical protein
VGLGIYWSPNMAQTFYMGRAVLGRKTTTDFSRRGRQAARTWEWDASTEAVFSHLYSCVSTNQTISDESPPDSHTRVQITSHVIFHMKKASFVRPCVFFCLTTPLIKHLYSFEIFVLLILSSSNFKMSIGDPKQFK